MRDYIRKLKEKDIEVHSLVVIGSRAYGYYTTSSDIDVVVIIDDYEKVEETFHLGLNTGYIEPRIYAREDAEKLLECYDAVLLEALEFGVVFHDDGFWQRLRKTYEERIRKNVEFTVEDGRIIAIKIKIG